jgi:DNA ligase (NAD+)
MISIEAPTHCPSCASELIFVNHILYCENTSCASQCQKKVEHFAKVLKIKGLGPSSISKLGITDFDMIYALSEAQIAECLSSDKLAAKLYSEIQNSKSASLDILLPALGIPLIGTHATRKLSTTITCISEISRETCVEAGLGPKATDSLIEWLHHDYWPFYDGYLPFSFKFDKRKSVSQTKAVAGIVCITGKLKSFSSKSEATSYLEQHGFIIKSTLTKDCTHLINESGIESIKTKNARDKGVIVTTIHELIKP